ncbi:MAG TPA: hypothetical protein ACFYD5_05210, partial [Candidatus Tripitaka sp. YC43]
ISLQLSSNTGLKVNANAILDTGSSITLVPEGLPNEIQAQVTGADIIMDITGKTTLVPLYDIQISSSAFPTLNLPSIQAAEMSVSLIIKGSKCIIAGRDLLNQFKLILDGPQLKFDLQ